MKVSCVLVHARCSALHKTAAYTVSFFEIREKTMQPRLVDLDYPITIIKGWILQTARHSNNSPARRDRAVYKLQALCLAFTVTPNSLPASMSKRIFQATLSDPDVQGTGSGYVNVFLSSSSIISNKQINRNSSRTSWAPEIQVTIVTDAPYSRSYHYACHGITPTFSTGSCRSYFSLLVRLFQMLKLFSTGASAATRT